MSQKRHICRSVEKSDISRGDIIEVRMVYYATDQNDSGKLLYKPRVFLVWPRQVFKVKSKLWKWKK